MTDSLRLQRRIAGVILGVLWDVSRSRTVAYVVVTAVFAGVTPLVALMSKVVVDAIVAGDSRRALLAGAAFIAAEVLQVVGTRAFVYLTYDLGDRITHEVETRILRIVLGAPGLEHLERADLADQVQTVRNYAALPLSILAYVSQGSAMAVSIVSSVVLLGAVHPVLLVLPLGFAPLALVHYKLQRREFESQEAVVREQRLHEHLLSMATGHVAAKEVRVFGLGPLLVDRYERARRDHARTLVRAHLHHQAGLSVVTAAQALVMALTIGLVVVLAITGRATIGSVVMAVRIVMDMVWMVGGMAQMLGGWAVMAGTGERLLSFLDYRPAVQVLPPGEAAPAPARIERGIELADVSFVYPGTDTEILSGVSLRIPAGTTIALVGENGAGKTSLVKLLCRFYDPTQGHITVDGVDLRRIDLHAWRTRSTAVFQDFASYHFLAGESIGVGDVAHLDDADRVMTAARAAGAAEVVERLPAGLATQIGREFDGGVDLSAGERQRIALARGSMRTSPALVILDEPTASLDARAEHDIFTRFVEMARPDAGPPPITVLVSHRFSTVRMADIIAVLHEGRLEEVGSHNELMRAQGRYAELYTLQASRYT